MADIYINPSAATNGNGSAASPYNTWVGVPVAAGNRYFQKRGTTYTGSFPSLTSGTVGNLTMVSAYENTDGTDNTSLPKPIINIGDTIMPGTLNSPKTFMKFYRVDIRNNRSSVESDKPIMWLGDSVEIIQCNLATNLTALYGEKVNNIRIEGNTITCATATGAVSMNAIVIAGSASMTGNVITANTIIVGGGGTSSSHVIKCEPSTGYTQTNLKITYNVIRTQTNTMSLIARRGISINNCTGGEIAYNNVAFMHAGFFATGVSVGVWVHHNSFNNNGAFGIHITTNTSNFLIEWNTCNQNGGNYSWMNWYGRGIELSGAGLLHSCTGHLVRFNNCSQNINYGGPSDNATEGVGIGLDDASTNCIVYGNLMYQNEGNGLQTYGGSTPPTDTGGHIICNNHFINNATQSYRNRRSGTKYLTDGACGLSLGGTFGSKTVVCNNLFIGGYGGIHENSTCANIEKYNNVFKDQTNYAISTKGFNRKNATGGSYYDFMGILRKSAPNTERISFNPSNLTASGTRLAESGGTNLRVNSEHLDLWLKSGNVTVTKNAAIAPDGAKTAVRLDLSSTNTGLYAQSSNQIVGAPYVMSFFVKATTAGTITLKGSYSGTGATKVNVGTSWTRVSVTYTPQHSGDSPFIIRGSGDLAQLFVWGAQLEQGTVLTSYIPTLPQFISRASTKNVFGSDGVIRSVPANLPVYDHDSSMLRYENMILWSEDLTKSNWSKVGASVAVSSTKAPDDFGNGFTINYVSNGGSNWVSQSVGSVVGTFIISIYATTASQVIYAGGGGQANVSNRVFNAVSIGRGWYKQTLSFTTTGGGLDLAISPPPGATLPTSITVWGVQINTSTTALEYKKTEGTAQPKEYVSKGLSIESAATNLIASSENFSSWSNVTSTTTANSGEAPNKTNTATSVSSTANFGGIYRIQTATVGDTYSASIFVKRTSGTTNQVSFGSDSGGTKYSIFNLVTGEVVSNGSGVLSSAITDCGNGWFRLEVQYVVASTNNATVLYSNGGTMSMLVWGAQLEVGSKATSYISTNGSTVTRAADVVEWHTATRGADVCDIRQNIYSPNIPKKIVDLTVDVNSVPAHVQIAALLDGDKVTDPLLNSDYSAATGSALLDTTWRQGIPWTNMPVKQ